jgi:fructose-specific phosphotransferase system IIC component
VESGHCSCHQRRRKDAFIDLSILVVAPLAAIITVIWLSVAVLMRPRSEDRSLLPAFCAALLCNLLLDQPWYYVSLSAFLSGVTRLLLLTVVGFALGALVTLVFIKTTRTARDHLWPKT